MKTIVQYQYDLDQLLEQGKSALDQLADLEHNLQSDIHALQMQYKGREVSALNQTAKKSGREKGETQQRLEEEKHKKIHPYQELLEKIQQAIKDLS